MNNLAARHPDEGKLLRYLDGELPLLQTRQVQRHLAACWKCRTEVEELQATVGDCMRYRKDVLEAQLPAPPNAWMDMGREFDRIDAALEAGPFWKRLLPRTQSLRWSMAAAAAMALVAVLVYQLRETPAVQAANLLKRAAAAAAEHPRPAHRYQIRTRGLKVIRAATGANAPLPEAVAQRFRAAHYDSTDPLSARSFEQWRDSLAVKTDEVSTIPASNDSEERYRIETETPDGELASATLILRAADLEPLDGRLEFRDREWIEFSELTEPPAVSDGTTSARNVEVPVRPSVPSGKAALPPRATASISDELQVLSALHQIGADLGDPIEVKRSGGKVQVSGVGITPQRQQQIHRMLDPLPNVSLYFATPAAVSSEVPATSGAAATEREAAPATDAPAGAPAGTAPTRLIQQLGGQMEFERFSSQVLDANEAAMARAYALRGLAQRFPAAEESAMSEADRRELRAMAAEHVAAMASQIAAIQRVLGPVLASLGAPPAAHPEAAAAGLWQPAAEETFRASRRVEVLVSVLLGMAPGQRADAPGQLAKAMGELRADLDQCRKLLAQ